MDQVANAKDWVARRNESGLGWQLLCRRDIALGEAGLPESGPGCGAEPAVLVE